MVFLVTRVRSRYLPLGIYTHGGACIMQGLQVQAPAVSRRPSVNVAALNPPRSPLSTTRRGPGSIHSVATISGMHSASARKSMQSVDEAPTIPSQPSPRESCTRLSVRLPPLPPVRLQVSDEPLSTCAVAAHNRRFTKSAAESSDVTASSLVVDSAVCTAAVPMVHHVTRSPPASSDTASSPFNDTDAVENEISRTEAPALYATTLRQP